MVNGLVNLASAGKGYIKQSGWQSLLLELISQMISPMKQLTAGTVRLPGISTKSTMKSSKSSRNSIRLTQRENLDLLCKPKL
ncbi:unnamed protein product [Cercopithifilaria johnstoni]|uniref:Uncharacterized protein n=1 Tax=Cercopithifilaria johnstoni TaxID=2874296 RepID=A0A8J2MID6_9BILA|nr:unnamed protein product [Cercopithifilaria johnstoni]